jgi:hypothetical protein
MAVPSFDPTHAVRFDVPRGRVSAGRDDERVILVPTAAMDDIVLSAAPEAVEAFGRGLGSAIGRRAASRMGNPQEASLEEFVTQLAGEAAVSGVGAIGIERWGRALVIAVEGSPLAGTLLGPVVAAALEAATGRRVWATLLTRDETTARLFVGSERSTVRVRDWVASGTPWAEALAKLQGGEA